MFFHYVDLRYRLINVYLTCQLRSLPPVLHHCYCWRFYPVLRSRHCCRPAVAALPESRAASFGLEALGRRPGRPLPLTSSRPHLSQ